MHTQGSRRSDESDLLRLQRSYCSPGVLPRAKKGLSYTMAAGRAGTAVLCLLCIGLAAALPGSLTFEERDTCFGALDMLRACNTDMSSQDVQQLCCIPFYALEGMNCFCDEGVLPEVLAAMQGAAIKGLSACGLDAPFTAIFEKQERCAAEVQAGEDALLPRREEASVDIAPLTDDDFTQEELDAIFGFDEEEDSFPFTEDSIIAKQEESFDDFLDLGKDLDLDLDLDLDMDMDVSEDFGIEIVGGNIAEIIISDKESKVVVSIPSATTDVELIFEGFEEPEQPEALPALLAIAEDDSDNSVTALYDADFSDVNSMVNLISSWLGGAIASGAAPKQPIKDEETVKGLPQVLAEILANLQTTFAGTPLDVEISYKGGNKGMSGSKDTEIDIEIDPALVPVLEPQFLDARLQALAQKWNGRAVRPPPSRISDADLLELAASLEKEAPGLGNCFNTGICNWLCHHRRSLQYALGLETVLLVALFALYARYNRRALELEEMDADEESLRVPLIVSAADYADAPEKEPLWTLTTKVAIPNQ